MTQQAENPLLQDFTHPPFEDIEPQHIEPAVREAIAACHRVIEQVVDQPHYTWENLAVPLEEAEDRLNKIWAPVSHLNSVVSTPALRQAHDACLPLLSEYATYVGQHEGLYQAWQQLRHSPSFSELSPAQQRTVTETLRDFELSGVALPAAQKKRYGAIQARLSELSSTFSNQLLDATNSWFYTVTDETQLRGLPDSARQAAAEEAQQRDVTGWVFTLDIPSYLPVMMYADDRQLRETMYYAFVTRASDQGPQAGTYDNSAVMSEILALRQEMAQLLGYDNYAEVSLASKMADSPAQVESFLQDLAARAVPQAREEVAEIKAFAAKEYGATELAAWDLPYYAEKLKQSAYAISDEQLRPYFPEQQVLEGLFGVTERLFGVHIKAVSGVPVWHPDVRYYEIFDETGTRRAGFYLDLYARAQKRGGAWMADSAVRRHRADGSLQLPVAYLTCNLNKPVGDQPALFTHDDVITLFHEFGHGLHHMLTQMDVAAVSGINGVEWDAVELPSQFLENWCWDKEALGLIAAHYETGEPLPDELLDRMLAARNFQAAMQMVRQLEFSLFDMRLHAHSEPVQGTDIQAVLDAVRAEVNVFPPPAYNRFQHSFGHIFAGGYAAGYYSYKWAEVLSADAFARFEEDGIFNAETGRAFRHHVLEQGGSAPALELFKAFRGREPVIEPLLRHSGIAA